MPNKTQRRKQAFQDVKMFHVEHFLSVPFLFLDIAISLNV